MESGSQLELVTCSEIYFVQVDWSLCTFMEFTQNLCDSWFLWQKKKKSKTKIYVYISVGRYIISDFPGCYAFAVHYICVGWMV